MEIDKIKEIIELMKANDLKVLSIEDGDTELYLETHAQNVASPSVPQTDAPLVDTKDTPLKGDAGLIEVRANQIGIFYTQPDQDSPETFVSIGDKVEVGDQIGLIEIMKLFNEVRVDVAGTVEEILVANGEPVEFDQVLMLLKPEEA